MSRKRTSLFCPKCKRIGGFITKRWVKKTNSVPKFEDVTTIVQAWDYAATVCFQMHIAFLRFPPSKEIDESLSKVLYKEYTKICSHTSEEIIAFEKRQMSRLLVEKENRKLHAQKREPANKSAPTEDQQYYWLDHDPYKEKIRIPLPPNTGNITSSSIVCLYGALVFKSLSYICMQFTFSEEENRMYSYVICSVFNLFSFVYDDRQHKTPADWVKIYEDAKNHGISAASSLNPSFSLKGEKVRLSTKHIRNKLEHIEELMLDTIFCVPRYTLLMNMISYIIQMNQPTRQGFLSVFEALEKKLNQGRYDSIVEYYFIKHTLNPKSDIKWCSISKIDLANVAVIDNKYKLYENLIHRIVDLLNDTSSHLFIRIAAIANDMSHAADILQQLGFRKDIAYEKIKSNLILEGLDMAALSGIETLQYKSMNHGKS
jgi:hypothetical protein